MVQRSHLGRQVQYDQAYSPDILYAIPRARGRSAIGVPSPLPFAGVDLWTGYEVSWLNERGKPQVAVAEFRIPADSECLVESKSVKLYLNALNSSRFISLNAVREVIQRDIGSAVGAGIVVDLLPPAAFCVETAELQGESIDELDVEIDTYDVDPSFLRVARDERVTQALRSHLLRSNCPVTGQPDWASLVVRYTGPRIDPEGLLKYIVSFRQHTGFHEQCVERIFVEVMQHCRPEKLTVYARYTRRGGLDINPFRSNFEVSPPNRRNFRQ